MAVEPAPMPSSPVPPLHRPRRAPFGGLRIAALILLVCAALSALMLVRRGASGSLPVDTGAHENVVQFNGVETADGGALRLETQPGGATVFVNGRLLGATPLLVAGLPPGDYGVRLEKNGCEPQARTVRIASTSLERLDCELAPLPTGGLNVDILPQGAEVLLDGTLAGYTPLQLSGVVCGTHELLVRKTNFEPYLTQIEVQPGEPLQFSGFALKDRIHAMLDSLIKSEPQRLAHYIDLGHYLFVSGRMSDSVAVWVQGMEVLAQPLDFDGPGYQGREKLSKEEQAVEFKLRKEDEARFSKELDKHRNWPNKDVRLFREELENARENLDRKNVTQWEWVERAAQLNLRNQNPEKAVRLYEEHIRVVPADSPSLYKAHTALMKAHLMRRDADDTEAAFNTFFQKFEQNGEALRYFGAEIFPYQDRLGSRGRTLVLGYCEKIFRAALLGTPEGPEQVEVAFDLGTTLNFLNRSADAVPFLKRAVEKTPAGPLLEERNLRYADALRRTQQFDEAERIYRELQQSERSSIRESARTGAVYVRADRTRLTPAPAPVPKNGVQQ
jgi:tetratricopeptide (TPR) repeat protein